MSLVASLVSEYGSEPARSPMALNRAIDSATEYLKVSTVPLLGHVAAVCPQTHHRDRLRNSTRLTLAYLHEHP